MSPDPRSPGELGVARVTSLLHGTRLHRLRGLRVVSLSDPAALTVGTPHEIGDTGRYQTETHNDCTLCTELRIKYGIVP